MNVYSQSVEDVFYSLNSGDRGLTEKEANERLQKFGPNLLPEPKTPGLVEIFLSQFQSPLIYILAVAAGVVFLMNEPIDGFIILFVLFLNSVIGAIQEGKAQNALAALKKIAETRATVMREGKERIILDKEIVRGDIIILTEGDTIPADGRLITVSGLRVNEASLTGESEPSLKQAEMIKGEGLALGDQKNMVFKGTLVVAGSATAVVSAIGVDSAIGAISRQLVSEETEIPLKRNIRYLSRLIIMTVSVLSLILFSLGLIEGRGLKEMFLAVVSLAISVIPEGLPVVITLILAQGVWRMSKRNALVKKLQAVESLGQAKILAVDKTGTLTKNELVVRKIFVDGREYDVRGDGYESAGSISLGDTPVDPKKDEGLAYLGRLAGFCANASVSYDGDRGQWRVRGDPTEAAMLILAQKMGYEKKILETQYPKVAELPFDYQTKFHITTHAETGQVFLTAGGAPEVILERSTKLWAAGGELTLDTNSRIEAEKKFSQLSEKGLRVLAFASKLMVPSNVLDAQDIHELTFAGFIGIQDSLRPEVNQAMEMAEKAGIKVVMITGDHALTARAIAQEAGIFKKGNTVITGREIDALSDDDLAYGLKDVTVFARVNPTHKLRIIKAYRQSGYVVAMTGDGVNDAPSLVAADLGVAMGKIGTDVAKAAADIVLLDDNLGSVISAVEEGRGIYRTIRKVILYLFSTSLGEIFTITGALLLGYPLPLLASQIIWLNLVTDGFLTVALAMEPRERRLLEQKFVKPRKYIVDGAMAIRMLIMGAVMMIGTLWLFVHYLNADSIEKAWTVALTVLAVYQWFNAWNARSENDSVFVSVFSNVHLIGATITIVLLQLGAVYLPFMQKILRTVPLSVREWAIIVIIAFSIVIVEETRKLVWPWFKKPENRREAAVV